MLCKENLTKGRHGMEKNEILKRSRKENVSGKSEFVQDYIAGFVLGIGALMLYIVRTSR